MAHRGRHIGVLLRAGGHEDKVLCVALGEGADGVDVGLFVGGGRREVGYYGLSGLFPGC